ASVGIDFQKFRCSACAFQDVDFNDLAGDAELSQQQAHLVGVAGVGDVIKFHEQCRSSRLIASLRSSRSNRWSANLIKRNRFTSCTLFIRFESLERFELLEPSKFSLDFAFQYLQSIQAIDQIKLAVVRAKNVVALNRRLTFSRHRNVIADFL